ncbi:MAG TPA: amidohydrolase family protein [Gammaproteobacteria bacterium]|nr:amidohydrolase family protein [Gammaproteobacteria bacterium]
MNRRLCAAAVALLFALPAAAQNRAGCENIQDLLFVNGHIHTMDGANRIASSVRAVGDRVVEVGDRIRADRCTITIDLKGRTAIPGIIDVHNHVVLLGLRPGHDTRLESARSIRDVLDTLKAKAAQVPAGEWITSIGGFNRNQFTAPPEAPRFPTLAELDSVTPDHPVYLQEAFAGPSITNSRGKAFFESRGIPVGADGSIEGGGATPNPTTRALFELGKLQTPEDRVRGTLDALQYAASLGITTHLDEGGFPATHTPSDGAAHFDASTAYEPVLELDREGRLINRIRLNFLYMETDPATPLLRARLANAFPKFGDPYLRVLGIGEFTGSASPIIAQQTPPWINGTRAVAEAGWRNENHSLTPTDFKTIVDGWESINAKLPAPGITNLRWVLAHVPFITPEYIEKLKRLGAGVNVLGGWRWLSGTAQQNGPPFRTIIDSGIHVGMSSDGMQISPMNPWIGLYYAVTGKNARGELINAGQTIGRDEALRLYTAANGWFLSEESQLGTLEPGKYADLVVLDRDYFDSSATPDEEILKVHSVLTVVGGRIVYGGANEL